MNEDPRVLAAYWLGDDAGAAMKWVIDRARLPARLTATLFAESWTPEYPHARLILAGLCWLGLGRRAADGSLVLCRALGAPRRMPVKHGVLRLLETPGA